MDALLYREVEKIIAEAASANRKTLYEYEVYQILKILGIRIPAYRKINSADEITRDLLSGFGSDRVVLKIISPDVAHKQKAGGVKVLYKDVDFVKFSAAAMLGEFESRGIETDGALLVEFVEYSPELGNEILIGFQETDVFGPVVSFSKGGSDAELFAKHFSAPNLLLPPINREWTSALLKSTEIHNKYLQEGNGDYIEKILEATIKIGELSVASSSFFKGEGRYTFKEFEVNPLVFDRDGKLIAIDGYAVFEDRKLSSSCAPTGKKASIAPFFHPEGIAVVGVSAKDRNGAGSVIAENIAKTGRKDLYCVNPRGGEVELCGRSFSLYRDLKALSKIPELVIITVPAAASIDIVRQAADIKARAILLIPGGFGETGDGAALENEIKGICDDAGIRVMGPNCLGIIYASDRLEEGLNTFFIPETKFKLDLDKKRNIALFSQSGGLGLVELTNLKRAVSPRVVVSYGNQLDVDPSDLVEYFQKEGGIDVIGIYIEGFKPGAGRRFFEVTRKSQIPIVVYKAGRTAAGRIATQSHTASMAGEYAVARAAMKQAGLVVANTMADHLGCLKIFAMLPEKVVNGRRIAVVTNAGYEKANAADNLKELELAELSEETSKRLSEALPSFATVEPLLDLTPMADDEVFAESVRLMVDAPEVDAVCVSIVPHSGMIHTTDEEVATCQGCIASRLAEIAAGTKKPIVVSLTAAEAGYDTYGRMIDLMDSAGLPTYLSAEQAMGYLNEFIRYHMIRRENLLDQWMK